jgi:hypothetical protein
MRDTEAPRIEVLDRATYETIRRLSGAGLLGTAPGQRQELFRSPLLSDTPAKPEREQIAKGAELLGNAERKLRMALLLAQGGFADEAMPALNDCLALAADARKLMIGEKPADPADVPEHLVEPRETTGLPPLDEIASTIQRVLGDVRRSLGATSLAA